jgi:hypothetical protein
MAYSSWDFTQFSLTSDGTALRASDFVSVIRSNDLFGDRDTPIICANIIVNRHSLSPEEQLQFQQLAPATKAKRSRIELCSFSLDDVDSQFQPGPDSKPVIDFSQVVLDHRLSDRQLFADLTIGDPGWNQEGHFVLAGSEFR